MSSNEPFQTEVMIRIVCLFDAKLGGKATYFPEGATFCHKGRYYAGPSNKPFLTAKGKAVPMEASLGKLLHSELIRSEHPDRNGCISQTSQP